MARVMAAGPLRGNGFLEASPVRGEPCGAGLPPRSRAAARGGAPTAQDASPRRRGRAAASPRDRLLLWLLGEETYRHAGSLEQSVIVALFCTLAASLLFTVAHSCLHPGGACAAERSRRLLYEEEAARLHEAIEVLRAGAVAAPPASAAVAHRVAEDLPSPRADAAPTAAAAAAATPPAAAAAAAPLPPLWGPVLPPPEAAALTAPLAGGRGPRLPGAQLRGAASAAAAAALSGRAAAAAAERAR
uniref:Uncharacterized protein n=1 Tax=Pyrodinium bahamense TaxID=73915 RepID=A0A7S0AU60_9DINO